MKAAIATDSDHVSKHFGRCTHYTMLEIEEQQIVHRELIPNPGHRPHFLPEFLSDQNVDCILSGGMGRKARDLFDQYGIETIVGVEGEINEVIDRLLQGDLSESENLCSPGHSQHKHGDCH
ncbi:MAG TPA: NifB/NifX family molybdenum-iron cluster-binding protein [bacterium]|nr:NifB/NifX family molybdenum-iron cluster-binding protein [bacterium]